MTADLAATRRMLVEFQGTTLADGRERLMLLAADLLERMPSLFDALDRVGEALDQLDEGKAAAKSRDFGRGVGYAVRAVRDAMAGTS